MKTNHPGFLLAVITAIACLSVFAQSADTAAAKAPAPAKPTPKPRKAEDASTPAPVNAGRQKAFMERAKDTGIQLVFLGDSITDFWQNRGKAVWDEYYAK